MQVNIIRIIKALGLLPQPEVYAQVVTLGKEEMQAQASACVGTGWKPVPPKLCLITKVTQVHAAGGGGATF